MIDEYQKALSRTRSSSFHLKRFFIGQEPPDLWVLRDSSGNAVSEPFFDVAELFKWCHLNGYMMENKNPLIRKKCK